MRKLQFKFPNQIRISGWDFGSSARAMNQAGGIFSAQADLEKVFRSTTERKSMSTKTTIKRIALVAVSALASGMLTAVVTAPASNAVANALAVSVGPNSSTSSVTVVGASDITASSTDTPGALIRIDVSSNDTSTPGLIGGETVTARIVGVPSADTKTVANNGGLLSDTSVAFTSGKSDLLLIETKAGLQTSGTVGSSATTTTSYTNWSKVAGLHSNVDTVTTAGKAADSKISVHNSYARNMDGTAETSALNYTRSYYATVVPRLDALVVDKGFYTIRFTLTDANENIVGTAVDIKVQFVSSKSLAGAALTLTSSGSFFGGETLTPTGAAGKSYWTATLADANGGLIRKADGTSDTPTVSIRITSATPPTETGTAGGNGLLIQDNGVEGRDFGNSDDENIIPQDGVYGISADYLPTTKTSSAQAYQIRVAYGNALATSTLTILGAATSGTAGAGTWTATGKVDSSTAGAIEVPLTTKSATISYKVTSSGTAQTGYSAYYTLAYTGCTAGDMTPVKSSDRVKVLTDATGVASLTITNANPVDLCQAKVVWSGTADGDETFYVTFLKPKATTAVTNPSGDFKAVLKSTNKITYTILDQFSQPVVGATVVFSHTGSNKPAATPASVITDANGQVSYTVVDALAVAAGTDTVAVSTVSGAAITTSGSRKITYVATAPVVSKITAYYDSTSAMSTKIVVPTTNIGGSAGITQSGLDQYDWTKANSGLTQGGKNAGAIWLQFTNTDATDVAVTGVAMTVTVSDGGTLIDPSTSKTATSLTLYSNQAFAVIGAKTGVTTVTATTGTVTAKASINFVNAATDARVLSATSAGSSVTVTVKDFYGNAVGGVAVDAYSSGGAFLGNGASYSQYTTAEDGTVTLTTTGAGSVKVSLNATAKSNFLAGYGDATGTTAASPAPAGVKSATVEVTGGIASSDSLDAANEATEAANAATDAANAAAEAADAATAAAQDAQAAVADLAAQVATLISGIKAQITRLTNLVIKIQKKVNA